MATITPTEAAYWSTEAVPDRYTYDCRPTDQFFDLLPFEPVDGQAIRQNVIAANSATGLKAYAGPVAAGAALIDTMPSISERLFATQRIAAQLEVDSSLLAKYGSQRSLVEALIKVKVDAVRDQFKYLAIEGDSTNSGEFDGLKKLCTSYSQTTGANGSAADGGVVQQGEIETLIAMVRPRPARGGTYLVMSATGYERLLKNNYSVDFEESTPVIAGIPVLINDFVPNTETEGTSTTCTSVYCVNIGKGVGVFGIYPKANEGQPIQVRGPVVKEDTDSQWYHVSMDCGLAVASKCTIARLSGVLGT